jgi:hypothetical protein
MFDVGPSSTKLLIPILEVLAANRYYQWGLMYVSLII